MAAAARHKSRYIHFQRPHFGLHRQRRVITKQQAARENRKGEVLCAILSNLAAAVVLLSCLPAAAESIELLNEPMRDVFARLFIDPHQQQKHVNIIMYACPFDGIHHTAADILRACKSKSISTNSRKSGD